MKRILLVLIAFTPFAISIAQNVYYHVLNHYDESENPVVELWNVEKERAKKYGLYIEEYTDSLNRVTKLKFYAGERQQRMMVDAPDYVCFEYYDSTIVVTELFALSCWYEGQYMEMFGDSLYATQYTMKYSAYYCDFYRLTSGYWQTIDAKRYYAEQLIESGVVENIQGAYDYLERITFCTEGKKKPLNDIEKHRVPFYEYSFCKNGLGCSEPRGWCYIFGRCGQH